MYDEIGVEQAEQESTAPVVPLPSRGALTGELMDLVQQWEETVDSAEVLAVQVNGVRGQLSEAYGIHISLERFDQGRVSVQVAAPIVPGLGGFTAEDYEATPDNRSASDIRREALETERAVTAQEEQQFADSMGNSFERAVQVGLNQARQGAAFTPSRAGEVQTRGYS